MSGASLATWQTVRLGLHQPAVSRLAVAALRATTSTSKLVQPQRHHRGIHSYFPCALFSSRLKFVPESTRPNVSTLRDLRNQSRCVSFWKPKGEDESHLASTNAENEISVTSADIDKVFGKKLDPVKGLDILLILQEHRLQGTLDHKLPFSDSQVEKGLAYLRTVNPIDEDAAIIARIDRETFRRPQTNIERSPQAVSQFEKLREHNKKKNELEEAKSEVEKEEKLKRHGRETSKKVEVRGKKTTATSNDLVQLRPEPEWVRNYREKATNYDSSKVIMSNWARLLPSAAITITVVAFAGLFAQNYIPPSRNARLWPEIPPAAATVLTIVGINCLVFVLWRIPPLWNFMNRNFLIAPVFPYSMSMIGACFSHQHLTHLLSNMLGLWLVGTRVHDDIGRGPFLALYFSSAAITAYVPMAVYVLRSTFIATTLGASGAVCGLLGALLILHEGTTVTLPMLPPEWTRGIDTGVILGMCILWEILSIRKWGITPAMGSAAKSQRPIVDNMGHLTGYIAGGGAAAIIRSTDPKWSTVERHHFLTRDFGKTKDRAPPKLPPTE